MEKGGLASALKENGVTGATFLAWADEMRVGLLGQLRRVWAPIGVKVRQKIQMQRKWCYLALAVDGVNGTMTWHWIDSMKSVSVAKAVRKWQAQGIQALIWDGARGHKGPEVKSIEVKLIQQPPYAPELNPAERVFEELRREIEGRIYTTLEEKMSAVDRSLIELAQDSERVRRLTGWQWIKEAKAQLS